jgi:glucosamine-6-phosphate deaminase
MKLHIAKSDIELGRAAAHDITLALRNLLQRQQSVRMILAAAPSQREMLASLVKQKGIDWTRVTVFHMDEYIGLSANAPQRFASWLRHEFADHVPLAQFEPIDPGDDPEEVCRMYAVRLANAPIDIVLLGIGTNGHLAFNDPPANLNDPAIAKVVTLDAMCREQQVFDGCFATLDEVPRQAITLTIPTLLAGHELFCCVPGSHKRAAVRGMLESPISGDCPATALRLHPRCRVYLDRNSSPTSNPT